MLEELRIRNYALAEDVRVVFGKGLNILSGETGAGKSVIIGALGLVTGDKADVSVIRSGADETEVSAVVKVDSSEEALQWLSERDIEPEEGAVVIRRILRSTGRSSSYIQSSAVTLRDLSDFTSPLFDIHGQHEHQSLLSVENHRKLLDLFAGLDEEIEAFAAVFTELGRLRREFQDFMRDERDMLRDADLAEFALKEIDAASLSEGEEQELDAERKMLQQAGKFLGLMDDLRRNLSENQGGALAGLRDSVRVMTGLSSINEDFSGLASRLESALYEVEDILDTAEQGRDDFDFSPGRLEACEERLAEIRRLRKKYGDTVEDILAYRDECASRLEKFENRDGLRKKYNDDISAAEKQIAVSAARISAARKEAAVKLSGEICGQLIELGMPKARFVVDIGVKTGENGRPVCGPSGYDQVEFMISPNQGESPKKLRNIASGGELSRVMLAVKSILAETDRVSCMVFDEIDSGIGGEVALKVGEHMHKLAFHKQILCITHLASIAVRADNHIKVIKQIRDGRTYTEVRCISADERTAEIARMLSGDSSGEASLAHAENLLGKYSMSTEGK